MFTADYLFPSPSQAAGIVLGRSANSWTEWKIKGGSTLYQELRSSVEDADMVVHGQLNNDYPPTTDFATTGITGP